MLPKYEDILALTDAKPSWWDEHGVPRFAPFHPRLLGVHDEIGLLVILECAECGARLPVGVGYPLYDPDEGYKMTAGERIAGFFRDDPPRHGCPGAGETMTANLVGVEQVWEFFQGAWVRLPVLENRIR